MCVCVLRALKGVYRLLSEPVEEVGVIEYIKDPHIAIKETFPPSTAFPLPNINFTHSTYPPSLFPHCHRLHKYMYTHTHNIIIHLIHIFPFPHLPLFHLNLILQRDLWC